MQINRALGKRLGMAVLLIVALIGAWAPSAAKARDLQVGMPQLAPDIYLDAHGHISGILGAILQEIASHEGWSILPRPCQWAECMRLLQSGAIDLLPDVTWTPERAETLGFHQTPVLLRSSQLYVREQASVHSLADLKGERIAVLAGSVQQGLLQSLLSDRRLDAALVPIDGLDEGFGLVQQGKADAVIADYFFGALAAPKHRLIATPVLLPTASIFFAAARGLDPAVLGNIERHLIAWKNDPESVYFQILARWGLPAQVPAGPSYVHWASLLAGVLVLMGLWWVWRERHDGALVPAWLQARLWFTSRLVDGDAGWVRRQEPGQECTGLQPTRPVESMAGLAAESGFSDTLTDLADRRVIVIRIEQALALAQSGEAAAALLVLDLDDFRAINQSRSLQAGDQVLRQVATRLLAHTRARDTVSRSDSDEFTVLLTRLGTDARTAALQAMDVARKLHHALVAEPLDITGGPLSIGVSIGVTLLHPHSGAAADVLREASIAMHRAEGLGGNQIVMFDETIRLQIETRYRLEADLVRALAAGDELRVYLQPQFARDGRVSGAELLARWDHPALGVLMPADFIPLAREIGQLDSLTRRMIALALQALADLQRVGDTYPLSVNVSPEAMADPGFIRAIGLMLDGSPASVGRLVFEITEEIRIVDMANTVRHMQALHERGIRFSIDDFGTGYASLAYLRKLPLYELKIDRSLVEGIPDQADGVAIVRLTLALARRLGLRAVAEGVENQAQADFLFKHRCDAIQGFLRARPMPVDAWLRQRQTQDERCP